MHRLLRRSLIVSACALTVAAGGCSQGVGHLVAPPAEADLSPAPTSPEGIVRRFEWSWKNRGAAAYASDFTDDYRFQFEEFDSAGSAYRDVPWTREDELRMAGGMFTGNADHARASDIQLDFDRTLIPLSDDRPGRQNRWHRSIRTHVDLKVTFDRGAGPEVNEVHGFAKFYLVRGDSAAIPPDLVARGVGPDSTRWWIDRWEDETSAAGVGTSANPTMEMTWGRVKVLFR